MPVPSACVKLAAYTAPQKVASTALVTASVPMRFAVEVPTGAVTAMLPAPATSVRLSPLALVSAFTVDESVMFPARAPLDSCTFSVSMTAPRNERFAPEVVTFAPRLFAPVPSCVKLPVETIGAVAEVVKSPAFVTAVVPPTASAPFSVSALPLKSKAPE